MAPRNRTRLNLRIVDEGRRVPERVLREAPEAGDRVGAFLRLWRERRGWTIDQVAWVLRIRLVYLEAMENDRFEDLPGRIYVTGFVRSYAKLLGLDEEAVLRQLRREHPGVDVRKALVFPEPPAERAVPGGALMAVGMMAAIMVYGGWYYQTASSLSERATIASVPAHLIATAEPSGRVGALAQLDLPAAIPMQPPMRPPPTRTVVADLSGSRDAAPLRDSAVAGLSAAIAPPVATPPAAVAEVDGAARSARGLPPDLGGAPPVEIALAGAGHLVEERQRVQDTNRPAASPSVPAVEFGRPGSAVGPAGLADAAGSSMRVPWDDDRIRNFVAPATGDGYAPPPPPLPTAEMLDRYAERLPADVIPSRVGEPAVQSQPSPSASAAWAGSVDGMTAGQWGRPASSLGGSTGPVILNAVEATWIEVREGTGQVVTGRLLQPGDTYAVPSREGLKLTTGNAGGLEVLVGGRTAPGLGPRGAVRRDISLDGQRLLAGEAVRN